MESDGIELEDLKLEKMPFDKPIPPLPDSYTNLNHFCIEERGTHNPNSKWILQR